MKVRTMIWTLEQMAKNGDITGEEEIVSDWGHEVHPHAVINPTTHQKVVILKEQP